MARMEVMSGINIGTHVMLLIVLLISKLRGEYLSSKYLPLKNGPSTNSLYTLLVFI